MIRVAVASGFFERYFTGEFTGLSDCSEDIDAVTFTLDGRLVVSTHGSYTLNGLQGKGDDLIVSNQTDIANATDRDWELLLDDDEDT